MPLIKVPFAQSGDKADVPLTDAAGGVNFTQGYPAAYSKDPETDPSAKRIERELFNGLMNAVTGAINEVQTNGVKPFITSAENGGAAFVYGAGVPVLFSGALYVSKVAANTTDPTNATNWHKIPYITVDADGTIHSKTPAAADNTDKVATTEWLRSMVVGSCGALTGGKITGAIIERGNNANGIYTKFSDGTMICSSVIDASRTFSAIGNVFVTAPNSHTYPASFVVTQQVPVSCYQIIGAPVQMGWAGSSDSSGSPSGSVFRLFCPIDPAAARRDIVGVIVFGRWF